MNLFLNRFLNVLLLAMLCACGTAEDTGFGAAAGTYQPNLVFPSEYLLSGENNGNARALVNLNCSEIAWLNFTFNDESYSEPFACSAGRAVIAGIPAARSVRVIAYALDADRNIVLQGDEVIDIRPDVDNIGGQISMNSTNASIGTGTDPSASTDSDSDTETDPTTDTDSEDTVIDPSDGRIVNDFDMEFVLIPAVGRTFTMGSPIDELGRIDDVDESEHQVTLTENYYMQITEVTQAQWRRVWEVAGENNISTPTPGREPSFFDRDDCPVETVTWNEVIYFIDVLNRLDRERSYKLPSEIRWEFAARGGMDTALPTGDNLTLANPWSCDEDANLIQIAWYCNNSDEMTHPVGILPPNGYGLHDMLGNVWEWCHDVYAVYNFESLETPVIESINLAGGIQRVVRGGSFLSQSRRCRSAHRNMVGPNYHYRDVGFRLEASLVR